jgi:hypothetical protein
MNIRVRVAEAGDVPALRRLIEASVLGLLKSHSCAKNAQGWGTRASNGDPLLKWGTRCFYATTAARYCLRSFSPSPSNSRNMMPLPKSGWRVITRPRMEMG